MSAYMVPAVRSSVIASGIAPSAAQERNDGAVVLVNGSAEVTVESNAAREQRSGRKGWGAVERNGVEGLEDRLYRKWMDHQNHFGRLETPH